MSVPPPPAYQVQQAQAQAHIPVNQFANYPGSPGISSGMNTPSVYSPAFSPAAPTPPPGGFAHYQYEKLSNTQPLMTDYSVHQQVYRPTEDETISRGYKQRKKEAAAAAAVAAKGPRGKLEDRADKLERGVGSLFKKLEKKIG
jgi:hypothetical protein